MTMQSLGCDYTGYEFGGGYIDSTCIDGYLWDLDSCDEPGGGLTHGGEWACPRCNTIQFLTDAAEEAAERACGKSMGHPWCAAILWEAASEQPEITAAFLAALPPFVTCDWPDREAVFAGRASWEATVNRQWPWDTALRPRLAEATR